MFIVLVLLAGQAFFMISNENINVSTEIGKELLGNIYLSWFGNVYDKVFDITGNVINVDWFSYNSTNLNHS